MATPIPKMKDIASAAGVHAMTVSRALRNTGRMRPETRQRVIDAARQLAYRPHAAAAAMRTGHTGCLVLLSRLLRQGAGLNRDMLAGILQAVHARRGYLAHATLPEQVDLADASTLPHVLGQRLAEGVLVDDSQAETADLDAFLRRNRLPAVWLNSRRAVNAVVADDRGAARRVTEQLLSLGHRRIACLRGVREDDGQGWDVCGRFGERIAGYEQAMREAGLVPGLVAWEPRQQAASDASAAGVPSLDSACRDPARCPTAVLACADGSVVPARLQQYGLRVPDQVSVVSFTDNPWLAGERVVSWVPLPNEELGRSAVDMLWNMLERGACEAAAVVVPFGAIASLHTVRRME